MPASLLPVPGATAIKICGLTRRDEALACAAHGVWGIGFVFAAESSRNIAPAAAADIAAALPAAVARVGVVIDPDPADAAELVRRVGLTHIQVHGSQRIDAVRAAAGVPVIAGVRVDGLAALDAARVSAADLVLLDAAVPGSHGGTGTAFDWELLTAAPLGRPFGLAGGLDPNNVGRAIARVAPLLVDVSSGVESAPGRKDPALVAAFCAAVTTPVGASV